MSSTLLCLMFLSMLVKACLSLSLAKIVICSDTSLAIRIDRNPDAASASKILSFGCKKNNYISNIHKLSYLKTKSQKSEMQECDCSLFRCLKK